MDLEGIMLSEISQTEEGRYRSHLYTELKQTKLIGKEIRRGVSETEGGEGLGGKWLGRYRFHCKISDSGDVSTTG